ncbi:hypothetical protein [Paraburkholderia caribensis]|uniref:hypothetical protein n=1 Tax=Paraburkholderia caribensis TaxID=75105 RepID=UPI001D072295|nr:hypothetical protein [Paraburkholderia caribensis]
MDAEAELARISANLLNSDYMPTFRRQRIAREVVRAATAHGLVKNGAVQWELALDFFRSAPYIRLLARVNLTTERTAGFREVLVGARVPRHPLQCIALLKSLHGTWNAVEQNFSLPDVGDDLHPAQRHEAESAPHTSPRRRWIEKHRARWFPHYQGMYREFRRANPKLTHSQLLRLMPDNARYFISRESLAAAGEHIASARGPKNVIGETG